MHLTRINPAGWTASSNAPCPDSDSLKGDERARLGLPDHLVLWGLRVSAAEGHPASSRIDQVFYQVGAGNAVGYLVAVEQLLRANAAKPIGIAPIDSARLSADERSLLEGIGLLQHRRSLEAVILLRPLVRPMACIAVADQLRRLATALAEAGLTLTVPERPTTRSAWAGGSVGLAAKAAQSRSLVMLVIASALWLGQANAEPASSPAWQSTTSDGAAEFLTGFWHREKMVGDMGGLRTVLGDAGIDLGLTETSEVLGNTSGGLKQGATYDGLTTLTLQLDTLKAFGWEGGTFNVSALNIHGRNLSQYYLANLQTASGIEASNTTRLWEIWYDQSFANDLLDIRIGQQSIDQEFLGSSNSALFVNTMMGWPLVPSVDLYAGGPAYPLSSLGVRLRGQASGPVTVLAGAFQDNPPGGPFADDSQLRGSTRFGGNFNLRTGALFLAEIQYVPAQPKTGDLVTTDAPPRLPASYKLGVWYDTAPFPDQRFGTDGLSLADPHSNGTPRLLRQNFSIYGIVDQMIWRPAPDSPRSISVFARAMGAPGDRNLVNFSINGGITLKAPLPGRDDDTLGLGFGVGKLSGGAIGLDQDTARFGGASYPIRSSETFAELTYQVQLTPWLQVQPDMQYVFTPGGGVPDPNQPGQRLGNEAIFGARTNITF